MQLLENKFSQTLGKTTNEEAEEVLRESLNIIDQFLKLKNILCTEEEYSKRAVLEEDFETLQEDTIEEVFTELEFEGLTNFSFKQAANGWSLQRRLKFGMHYLDQAYAILKQLSSVLMAPNSEQLRILQELTSNILAEFSYFVYYQFEMDVYTESMLKGKDIKVNISLYEYTDQTGESVESIALKVKGVLELHRPKFTLFEEYPELEEEFYSIAGAYIRDFDMLEDKITLEIVHAVITGKVDPEDAVKALGESEEG